MKVGLWRWTLCAALVGVAHVAAIWSLSYRPTALDDAAGAPVVMLDLAPIAAAPSSAQAPSPANREPSEEAQDEAPPAPPPVADPVPSASPAPTSSASVEPLPSKPTPPVAAAAAPENSPAKETAPPVVDAPERAETAHADQGREAAATTRAIQSWQRSLIAQIERHKRFPATALGKSGIVNVAFAIDRDGRLLEVRVAQSSGVPALDAAALDLIRQAQPFPAPPATLSGRELSFVTPVRYLRPR